MSRSRRKTPIVGHTTCGSEREDKKLWHQRWRTRERTAWRQASISAELTPRPACVRRTASLCRYAASPLRASGQNSGSSADKVQQPTMPSLQLATRSSDLRTKVSANVRSIRATSQAGVPLADIHAAASCISRTTSSISPEQATRTFGGSSLSIRSPGAV